MRKIFAHLGNFLRQLLQKMYCNQSKNVLCNMQSLLKAEIQFYVSLYRLYKISKIGVRSWWGKESIVIFGDHLWSDKSIKDYKYILYIYYDWIFRMKNIFIIVSDTDSCCWILPIMKAYVPNIVRNIATKNRNTRR